MLGKTILFSGGKYDIAFIKQYLVDMSFDTVACADSGLEAAHAVGVNVDYIMGDFDSVSQETLAEYRRNNASTSSGSSAPNEVLPPPQRQSAGAP